MVSKKQLEQRREAPRTHGVYSLQKYGVGAMSTEQLAAFNEVLDMLGPPTIGAAEVLRQEAALAVITARVAQTYVGDKLEKGADLGRIRIFTQLPTLRNSVVRCVKAYLDTLPPEEQAADAVSAEVARIHEQLGISDDESS